MHEKVTSVINRLIKEGSIPSIGKFEVTEKLMEDYYYTYKLMYGTSSKGPTTSSNTKYARRLAGLNLLRENINRGVKPLDIRAGHIYLISNCAFPLHYKIGISFNAHKRLLTYQTYSPYRDFILEKYDFVVDKFSIEKQLLNHPLLNKEQGEWVKKDNAELVFNDLARFQTSKYN